MTMETKTPLTDDEEVSTILAMRLIDNPAEGPRIIRALERSIERIRTAEQAQKAAEENSQGWGRQFLTQLDRADQATRELAGVRNRTIEECAKVCEAMTYTQKYHFDPSGAWCGGATAATANCVKAIRALSPLPIQDADKEKK